MNPATIHPISPASAQQNLLPERPVEDIGTRNASGSAVSDKTKLTKSLPTNRATLDKQLLLLRAYAAAYAHYSEALSIRQVAAVAKMDRSVISTANGFFLESGLVTKTGAAFAPSDAVMAFNHAYQWNPETAAQKLSGVLQETWFAKKLTPLLMLGRLSEQDAVHELAAASGAGPEHKLQLRFLLEFLEKAGVVKREGDSLVKGPTFGRADSAVETSVSVDNGRLVGSTTSEIGDSNEDPPVREVPTPRSTTSTTFNQSTIGMTKFTVDVKVDMAEFATWEPRRITAFFAGIAQVLAAKAGIEQNPDA